MHSNSHLGVSLMAMAHVASATSHLTYACDTHYPWQSRSTKLPRAVFIPIVDGFVTIPDKPGLGVSLDYDQLERGKERFLTPYRKRDDEVESASTSTRIDPKAAPLVTN